MHEYWALLIAYGVLVVAPFVLLVNDYEIPSARMLDAAAQDDTANFSGSKIMLIRLEKFYHRINKVAGKILSVVLVLMTLNIFYDVIMRYTFHNSSVGMQEMEWHLFSVMILFGVSVALLDEAHVRVDFIYDRFSIRTKAVINIIGTIFFLLPLAILIFSGSIGFVQDAYQIGEISEDPGGLRYRWIIKGMIPLAFAYLMFTAVGYTIQNVNLYRQAGLCEPESGGRAGEVKQ